MGVPGFFAWILKNYKKHILKSKPDQKPDWLFVDANCLFHPECFKILAANVDLQDGTELETKMFNRITEYLDYIEGLVGPTEGMFIAVDGVAPRAKLSQQRGRRYRSISDNIIKNKLKQKYGIKYNDTWSNTTITPGTTFMERLHTHLLTHYQSLNSPIKYLYSSYHTPGEGEHKILQYIRTTNYHKVNVIYGLDADLIFLALSLQIPSVYLLREETHLSKIPSSQDPTVMEPFVFVSIDETRRAYNDQITSLLNNNYMVSLVQRPHPSSHPSSHSHPITINIDYSVDFIFVCFLLGNDFISHFPSIQIHKGGLDEIISAYIECIFALGGPQNIGNQLLISFEKGKAKINGPFLLKLFQILGSREERFFCEILPKYDEYKANKKCFATTEYEKALWELENMKSVVINDPIKLGTGLIQEWKFRYYEHHFGGSEHQKDLIQNLAHSYLESIMWVTKYYFERCPDWSWEYPYSHAPFVSDVAAYLESIDINDISFGKSGPLSIQTQLLLVLPPACSPELATSYRSLVLSPNSPIIDMYPKKIKLNMLGKDLWWQCTPLLPPIDIERIDDAIKHLKLTVDERKRNKIEGIYTFMPRQKVVFR